MEKYPYIVVGNGRIYVGMAESEEAACAKAADLWNKKFGKTEGGSDGDEFTAFRIGDKWADHTEAFREGEGDYR